MKIRFLFVSLLVLSWGLCASAQTTLVSATVTDSGAVVWANGTYTFNFTPNPRLGNGPFFNNGVPYTPVPISGSLSGTGTLTSVVVPSNTTITPSGSTWTVTYCPQASGACQTSLQMTISGGSQNITGNFTPTALVIAPGVNVSVYTTAEVSGAVVGSQVYLIGTGPQFCSAVTGSTCTTWTGSSGGITQVASLPATCTSGTSSSVQLTVSITVGVPPITYGPGTIFYCDSTNHYSPVSQGSGASPIMGWYLSPQCPPSNSAQCFNTFANTQQANDCNWTIGTTGVTCVASHFVPGDTGKRAFGYNTCAAFGGVGANAITTGTAITITYVSATQVTLSSNAANSSPVNTGCFVWGNPDDTGAAALDAATLNAPQCPKVLVAAGYYMFTVPHFTANPTACKNLGPTQGGASAAGNMFYAAGYELEGRGTGTTVFYMTPGFPETGSCNFGNSTNGCWVVVVEGRWTNIMITGGGHSTSANFPSGKILMEVDGPASLDNFTCLNFGTSPINTIGIGLFTWAQLNQVNISACGDIGYSIAQSSSVTAIKVSSDNPRTFGWVINQLPNYYNQNPLQFDKYNLTCYDCLSFVGVGILGSPFTLMRNYGGAVKMYHGRLSNYNTAINGVVGYACFAAGCLLDAEDTYIDMSGNGTLATTGAFGINCSFTCTNILKNSIVKGSTSSGTGIVDSGTSSVLNDISGNIIGTTNISGQIIADGHSLQGSCTGVVTAASTLGLYGTGPNVTASTCTSTNIGTGVPMVASRTLQNLIVTVTAAGTNASSGVVTVLKNGGATALTCTVGTGTRCVDGTHTVSVVAGDLISIQFTTQAADTLTGVKGFVEWN